VTLPAKRSALRVNTAPSRPPARARVVPAILARLRHAGISLRPFLLVREGGRIPPPLAANGRFRFGLLTRADVDDLIRLEPHAERAQLCRWLEEGKLCYGMHDGARLIAKTWCDLDAFSYPPAHRTLDPDEAYLFAAYIDPDYRGHNLAPALRSACYAALRAQGRTRLSSYTDYFNQPARRFKQKLGAVEEQLCLHIDLFGKWSRTITLKRYTSG
jgi:GNAT superfamily N-acetyltransferase